MAAASSGRQGWSLRGAAEPGQRGTPAETREAILQAARQRFMHYGYKKTTIDEIAADAGVGKGTVYLYFEGKHEILFTLILEVKRDITRQMRAVAAAPGAPEDKLRRMISVWILTVYDAYTATAHGNEFVDDLRLQLGNQPEWLEKFKEETSEQHSVLAGVLREGHKVRVFEASDPERTAHLLMAAFVAYFPPYTCGPFPNPRSREEMEAGALEMMDFVLRGLRRCR
jgi:AcrR family transcriptional regulator